MENTQIKEALKKIASTNVTNVAVAYGDGIGPEIMEATLRILEAAGANILPEKIEIGEQVYVSGNSAGIENSAWKIINRRW